MSSFNRIPLDQRVRWLLTNEGVVFSWRRSPSSVYFEVTVDGKILLIRVSDHASYQGPLTWPPDYNVIDKASYSKMKKAMKQLKRQETFKKHVAPIPGSTQG